MKRLHRNLLRVVAAAAIALGLCMLILHLLRPRESQWERLVLAARQWRPVDGRLAGGFLWTSRQETAHASGTSVVVKAAASSLITEYRGRSDADSLRMMAAAALVTGNSSDARSMLEEAARSHPQHALIWNDLATARLATAIEQSRPADLPLALAAADRAIELAPELPEARFNRAAILERLGLRDQSCAEWEAYLELEPSGDWAIEAAQRLRDLDVHADGMLEARQTLAQETVTADALRKLVERYPQETRTYAEAVLFYQWADAERQRQPIAANIFRQLRTVGDLFAKRGDYLLADAVSAAERAMRDSRTKELLIDACIAYYNGRSRYSKEDPSGAEPILQESALLFREAGSPMAIVAECFMANTILAQNRVGEARDIYLRLQNAIDPVRHPSLAAHLLWQLALCDSFEGIWSACITRLRAARTLFEQQGETTNRAFVLAILAEAHDRIARVQQGWEHRVNAFAVLSRIPDRSRIATVVNGAVRAEEYRHQYESALSLTKIAIDESRRAKLHSLVAEAYTRRAVVLRELGVRDKALVAVAAARIAAKSIADEKLRLRATADTDIIEASIVRSSDPQRATTLLGNAIDFYTQHQHGTWVPAARLERGRAYKAIDNAENALADFEEGIREIERQRSTIQESELRAGFFNTVPDLFAEAVDLLISAKKNDSAFAMAERARARTLYEQLGIDRAAPDPDSAEQIRKRLGPDEVLVEFQLLPTGMAIFCLDRDALSVVRTGVDTTRVRQQTVELVAAVRNNRVADARSVGAALWKSLFEPVASRIDHAKRLIIVPDRFLHAVPFPALTDVRTNEYLVQRHELVLSPRGSFGDSDTRPLRISPALIIGDPTNASAQEPRLQYASAEARKIARLYDTEPLLGNAATREAVLAKAPLSALIHYAGHARDGNDTNESQLVLAGNDQEDILDASEIARLRLTNTSLVVLAACATLSGDTDQVEGIPSLARAFMAAGVPTVVGTLWDVPDDSTASMFLAFHHQLSQGVNPIAALRDVQLARIQSADQENMTWATVAIIGQR